MSRNNSGLATGEFDEVEITHALSIDGSYGTDGQVLKTTGEAVTWGSIDLDLYTDSDDIKIMDIQNNP